MTHTEETERLAQALDELVAEWDTSHADEDHRTGYTADTFGIELARRAPAAYKITFSDGTSKTVVVTP